MITFDKLWETMKKKGVTTYTLRNVHFMGSSTIRRMKKNMPISTYTLDKLCKILDCPVEDILTYVKD